MKDVKVTLRNIGRGGGGAAAVSVGSESRYGILGLLDVIRMTNPFMNVLALGQDLTAMGLNMNSTESLYYNSRRRGRTGYRRRTGLCTVLRSNHQP